MKEELTRRVRILFDMDTFIRDNIGDDDITEMWLMGGLPDGSTDEDIIECAKDNDDFCNIIKCFARCVAVATDDGDLSLLEDDD